MLELDRILVIIEPGVDNQPALEKAIQLANYADSELELFIADYSIFLEDGAYFDANQAQSMRQERSERRIEDLQALAQPLRDEGLRVLVATTWGNPPHEEILKRVQETNPSLVIKSTRHHPNPARRILSDEDWELVRYCPVPLLLAKGKKWRSNPAFIASVDPTHSHDKPGALDNKLVSSAASLSAISGGDVHLFHSSRAVPRFGVEPLAVEVSEEEIKLVELARRHGICQIRCHMSDRDIVCALPKMVDELEASAVFMGVVSRSRPDRLLIGNTAEKVFYKLACDVLVIHPDPTPAPV